MKRNSEKVYLVVCGCLLVVCGVLWSFAGGFWSFVVVYGGLWLLPVLVTTQICLFFHRYNCCIKYEKFLIIGDFNTQASETSVKDFCDIYSIQHIIKEPRCYKNSNNPKCIDLMLTNGQCSFQNSCVINKGLSDSHKMTVTVMR